TEISPAETFYPAEDYHQDYFNLNPGAGYCQVAIAPKLRKLGLL
ncbi:MAG: peptide-methionine (S)-S-oxide reductase, partial [Verrucomicrobiota bacterium]